MLSPIAKILRRDEASLPYPEVTCLRLRLVFFEATACMGLKVERPSILDEPPIKVSAVDGALPYSPLGVLRVRRRGRRNAQLVRR